jgi:hypothetical protein
MLRLLSHPAVALAAVLTLVPFFAAAFCPRSLEFVRQWPVLLRILGPALLALPYALVSVSNGIFHWTWLALYALLPVGVSLLLYEASLADPEQRGEWRDFLILALLGVAVDLRWFEPAWGPRLSIFDKMLLLDAGIYGFLAIRQLGHVGFDLRLRLRDLGVGLFALAAYAPIAVILGLLLGFLHFHAVIPSLGHALLGWLFTFFFIAVPEELFFRGWMQNLLVRYPRVCGCDLVLMVALRMITVVADTHPHVMLQGIWHDHCDTKSQYPVGDTQRIDIPVAQENQAGCDSPHQRDWRQHRIGQVSEGEKAGGSHDWSHLAGQ